jgi:hypothetical protein
MAAPQRSAHGGRWAEAQAIDVSRGEQTIKHHSVLGRPAVSHFTPGNRSDVKVAPDLIPAVPSRISSRSRL